MSPKTTTTNNLELLFDLTDTTPPALVRQTVTPAALQQAAAAAIISQPAPAPPETPAPASVARSPREQRNHQATVLAAMLKEKGTTPASGTTSRKILMAYTGTGGIVSSQESGGQYFTPYWICEIITRMIGVESGAVVLDPTCGTGRMFEFLPADVEATGIEIDPQAAAIAQALYPSLNIQHGDIRNNLHFRNQFDYIMGNPPFGLWWEVNPKKSNLASRAGKILSQWKILESSIQAVKEGGIIALVVPKNTFTNDRAADQRAARFWKSNCIIRAEIELPPKAFSASGTEWPCSVLIVQRPPASHAEPFQYVMKDKPEPEDIFRMFRQFTESAAYSEMRSAFGSLIKKRAKKQSYEVVSEFTEMKKEFDHEFKGKIKKATSEDTILVRRAGNLLALKPNGIIAGLKLEMWKKSFSWGVNWRKYLTINEIVLRDNIRGFRKFGLKMQIDPSLVEFMKGKRKFYQKENIDIKDVPTARGEQFKRNMEKLKTLNLWDKLFPYQRLDACIHADKNFSFIGYKQRLGKTRTAIAATLLKGTKKNLFVCYARLVTTLYDEMVEMGIPAEQIKIVRTQNDLDEIKWYNLISFETLRKQEKKDEAVTCPICGTLVTGKTCRGPNKDPHSDNLICGWHRYKDATCPKCGEQKGYSGRYCSIYKDEKGVSHGCGHAAITWKPGIYKRMRHLFSCIVVDESQAAKNKNSQQGQAIRSLKAKHKIILTGTILENYVSEAFWQLWWLLGASCRFPYPFDGGHSMFTKQFTEFEKTRSGRKRMKPSLLNQESFWKIFDSIMTRRTGADELVKESVDLPTINEKRIEIQPTAPEIEYYAKVMDDFENWYQAQMMEYSELYSYQRGDFTKKLSALVLVKLNMLRQVSSCPFKFEDYEGKETAKIQFIRGLAEKRIQEGKKILIASAFKSFARKINEVIPGSELFTGDITIGRRNVIKQRFIDDPELKALCMTTQVANLGLDLSSASTIIIADLLWSPKQMEQLMLRVWGPKQKEEEVEILFLINKEMIDVDMNDLITAKENAIDRAIDRTEDTGDRGVLWNPIDFANKMFGRRGASWIKKYL